MVELAEAEVDAVELHRQRGIKNGRTYDARAAKLVAIPVEAADAAVVVAAATPAEVAPAAAAVPERETVAVLQIDVSAATRRGRKLTRPWRSRQQCSRPPHRQHRQRTKDTQCFRLRWSRPGCS